MNQDFFQKLNDIIDANIGNTLFGAKELAELMGMSQSSLLRKVRSRTGKSINQYIREVRLKKALQILQEEDVTVSEVTFRLGFNSPSYFSACFRKFHGQLPGEVRKKNGDGLEYKEDVEQHRILDSQELSIQPSESNQDKKTKIIRIAWISAFLLVLIVSGYFLIPKLLKPSKPSSISIAVLPFKFLGEDSTKQYRADGMMLAIQQKLGEIRDLRIISGITMEQYRNSSKTIKTIGRELKVDYVFQGILQMESDTLNLLASLDNVKKEKQVFSNNYIKEWADVFNVQSEVAKDIAAKIKAVVTPEEKMIIERAPTSDLTAYDFYLLGNEHALNNYSIAEIKIAIEMYEEVIKRDSNYVLAWVGLAALNRRIYRQYSTSGTNVENLLLSKKYFDKAKSLSPTLKEVRIEEAKYYYQCKLNFPKALGLLENLKTEYPNDADIYAWIGYIYNRKGEFKKSLEYLEQAISLNPVHWEYWGITAGILRNHRLPESKNAEYYYLKTMELAPSPGMVERILNYYYEIGKLDKAREFLRTHEKVLDLNRVKFHYAQLELYNRNYVEAIKIAQSIPEGEPLGDFFTKHHFMGDVYLSIPDTVKAIYHYSIERDFLLNKLKETKNDWRLFCGLRYVFAGLGMKDQALEADRKIKEILDGLPHSTNFTYQNNIEKILVLVVLGEHDLALEELDTLMKQQSHKYIESLKYYPGWDPVRNHPKFKEIVSNPDYQLNF